MGHLMNTVPCKRGCGGVLVRRQYGLEERLPGGGRDDIIGCRPVAMGLDEK